MDAGVIVGYLVAYLSGKARRLADKAVDQLLERLYAKVASKLRGDTPMRRLETNPSDDQAQAEMVRSLSEMAASNRELAGELDALVNELDGRGAQQLIIEAPVHGQVFQNVTAQQGSIVGSIGRDVHIYQDPQSSEIAALRNAGIFAKGLLVLGMLAIFAGLGIFVYTVLNWNPNLSPGSFGFPPEIGFAVGLFLAGMILVGLTRLFVLMRRKR